MYARLQLPPFCPPRRAPPGRSRTSCLEAAAFDFFAAVPARERWRAPAGSDGLTADERGVAQPDPRPRVSGDVRAGGGVHPPVRARPRAAARCTATITACARCSTSPARRPSTSTCSSASTTPSCADFGAECAVIGPAEAIAAESAAPRSARGRAGHPAHRMDDAAPLRRQRPRRRRPRSAVQEPAQASLDGRGAARQARHADGRGAGRGPRRGLAPARSTNISRSGCSSMKD